MAKIITKGGMCSKTKKVLGFQFLQQPDGKFALGGSFGAISGSVSVSGDPLPAELTVADTYKKRGCKYCGNPCAYICPDCGAVICHDGKGGNEVCPSCGCTASVAKSRGADMPKATLVKKASLGIAVSSPGFDDIGRILDTLGIEYDPFARRQYDCSLLFLNCGTSDKVQPKKLREFVENGGCLYASDLTASILSQAFPELFRFRGWGGDECTLTAKVEDPELREFVGGTIDITFDLSAWAVLESACGATLLSASSGNPYAGLPLMVKVTCGNGTIFYTCFHNHAQASDKEQALLQLLVLKQLGARSKRSIIEVGAQIGVNVDQIKAKFGNR